MKDLAGGAGGSVEASTFISDSGDIRLAKLVGTLLGSLWLTVAAGWIAVANAIARVHIRIVDAAASMYARIIRAYGDGAAETLRVSWAESFQAAVEANRLFAPLLFTVEVVVVTALLLWARRRWT